MTVSIEEVAALIHQGWMNFKSESNVVFGPERTESTHPHMIPWDQLDEADKQQDRFIASIILHNWNRRAISNSSEDLGTAIHNAWVDWIHIQAKSHPHAQPYHEAHSTNPAEHTIQGQLISEYLSTRPFSQTRPQKQKKCIVLLPFREYTFEVYDRVVSRSIQRAGFNVVRADHLRTSRTIQEDVIEEIEASAAVVADLTGDNPNVNYEIGIAKSLGKPIVLISEPRAANDVPFYYRGQRIHFYDRNMPDWRDALHRDIFESLQNTTGQAPLTESLGIGLTGFYSSDNKIFEAALIRDIQRSESRIVAVGMGLAFINSHSRIILQALRDQVTKSPDLTVHIILARKDHPGLIERIREEHANQPNVAIIQDWPTEFFKFANELPNCMSGRSRERVFIRRLPYLPTTMLIKLDDIYFFRCYGPPNFGGWVCPWLRCDSSIASSAWSNFLLNIADHAVERCTTEPD